MEERHDLNEFISEQQTSAAPEDFVSIPPAVGKWLERNWPCLGAKLGAFVEDYGRGAMMLRFDQAQPSDEPGGQLVPFQYLPEPVLRDLLAKDQSLADDLVGLLEMVAEYDPAREGAFILALRNGEVALHRCCPVEGTGPRRLYESSLINGRRPQGLPFVGVG